MANRWRRNVSDATWLFVLPLIAAVLPWRCGFALLRAVARRGLGFGDVVSAAWREASAVLPNLDGAAFQRDLRLLLLVDRTDNYLTLVHGARWWQRHVTVSGDGLAALDAGLLLNTHWGAGHWIWRLLAARGIHAHFVVRRAGIEDVGHGRVSRWYLAWREWALRRVGCAGPVFTGGSRERIGELLAAGDSVLGMLDVPAAAGQRAVAVAFLGGNARLPCGLVQLALDTDTRITAIACGLDVATGRRRLHIRALPAAAGLDAVMAAYAAALTECIEAQPAFWQMWPQAPLFRQ